MSASLPAVFGRYQIVKKLGAGGMGAVYLAQDTQMERAVALKVPQFDRKENDAVLEQFYREARIAAKIRHVGICPVYDVGCIDGIHYLTMAYIEGKGLDDAIVPGKPWPPAQALTLITRVAEALQVLHAHGIVHRDLKPSNILLQPSGDPVLLDFGLARSLLSESQRLATKSAAQGTPAYMAPEQMGAQADQIRAWTDVYALGVILFELLTSRRPLQATSLVELCGQVMYAERPHAAEFAPAIGTDLDRLCLDMMAIDPALRPHTMAELIERLHACSEALAPATLPSSVAISPATRLEQTAPVMSEKSPHATGGATLPTAASPLPVQRPDSSVAARRWALMGSVGAGLALATAVLAWLVWGAAEKTSATEGSQPHVNPPLASQRYVQTTPTSGRTEPPPERPRRIANSIRMEMMLIPAGKFLMGSPPDEKERMPSEGPVHEVNITKAFYLGAFEVTQEEYGRVLKINPSKFRKGNQLGKEVDGIDTRRFPVENVSWDDAVKFCVELSNLPLEKSNRRVYRLPTEAEWEYACRAGSARYQIFHYGNQLTFREANFHTVNPYGATLSTPPLDRPTTVDDPRYKPNAFGLYQMHGNVREWCADYFDAQYYQACLDLNLRQDPRGPAVGGRRVTRGGSWFHQGRAARTAIRTPLPPEVKDEYTGFRVVCEIAP